LLRLASDTKLICKIWHDVWSRSLKQVTVDVNGTNPTFSIRVMIRLAMSVSGITDPTIRCAVTIWERVIDLFS
jgi:hypothetical protein